MSSVDPNLAKLPPVVDMSAYYKQWFAYDQLHENKEQKPIEVLARDNQCCMFSRDLVEGKMWREFKCTGFERMWKYLLTYISRQAVAYNYAAEVNHRSLPHSVKEDLNGACFYEMIRDNCACHLAFDIEYYTSINPVEKFDEVCEAFLVAVDKTFEEYYGLVGMRSRWQEVWTDSSIFTGDKPKVSRHLVIRLPYNLMFATWMHAGAFARRVAVMCIRLFGHPDCNIAFIADPKESYRIPLFDPQVYTERRSMRFLGCAKKGSFRPFFLFVRVDINGMLVNLKQSFKDLTRERFLRTLLHAPPDDPSLARHLHCTEPDGSPAVSHAKFPFYSGGTYCFQMSDIGLGGSMKGDWRCKSAAEAFARVANCGEAASMSKYRCINENEARDIADGAHEDDVQKRMALFCIDLGNQVASTLVIPEEQIKVLRISDEKKALLRLPDRVLYYRNNTDTHSMSFQMNKLWCPFKKKPHTSNHISYTIDLAPGDVRTADPLIHTHCFSCTSIKGAKVRIRWWNEEWDKRRAEYFELLDASDKVTLGELFGWIFESSDNEEDETSDDQDEGEEQDESSVSHDNDNDEDREQSRCLV